MKKRFGFIIFFTVLSGFVFSQINLSVRQNFVKAGIDGKKQILSQFVDTKPPLSLCLESLEFINTYYQLLNTDTDFLSLAELTIAVAIQVNDAKVLSLLESLFERTDNIALKNTLLEGFSTVAKNYPSIISLINAYAEKLFNTADEKHSTELLAAIKALSNFHDISSFYVLFNCYANWNNDDVVREAKQGLSGLASMYEKNIRELIDRGDVRTKRLALELVLQNSKNSDFFRAEISEKSLQNVIQLGEDVSLINDDMIALQMAAIRELQRISWTRSSDLVTQVFELAKKEYEHALLKDGQFIEIIYAFTRLASNKAGQGISDYLATLNKAKEDNKPYSKQVVLSVIQSLGLLGDKVAFDNLLYVTYQDYPEEIISAARDALVRLKW